MDDELLVHFGGACKALAAPQEDGKVKVGGYLIRYGSPAERDGSGEFFTKDTYLGPYAGNFQECLFEHSQPVKGWEHMADHRFHPIKTKRDDYGLFVETILDLHNDYEKAIYTLMQKGVLGWSSGSAQHRVRKSANGEITQWPVVEASITYQPCDPRLNGAVIPLKSLPQLKSMGTMDSSAGGTLVPNPADGDRKTQWRHEGESINDCVARKLDIIKQEEPNLSHEAALGKAEGMCHENKTMNLGKELAGKTILLSGKTYHIGEDGTAEEYIEVSGKKVAPPKPAPAKKATYLNIKATVPAGQQALHGAHHHLSQLSAELDAVIGQTEPGAEVAASLTELQETIREAMGLAQDAHAYHYPDAEPVKAVKAEETARVEGQDEGTVTSHEGDDKPTEVVGTAEKDLGLYETNREEIGISGVGHSSNMQDKPKKSEDDGEIIGHNIGPLRVSVGAAKASDPCENPNCPNYGQPHENCQCYKAKKGSGEEPTQASQGHEDEDEYEGRGGQDKSLLDHLNPFSDGDEKHAEEYAKMTPAQKAWVRREINEIKRLAARKRMMTRHEERLQRAAELRRTR